MTNPTSHRYTLPREAQPLEILQPLDPLGSMRIEPAVHGQRTYFDTFDWRLHAAGSILVEERAADGRARVCWRELADDRLLGLSVGEIPRFVRDLASRELREQLEPLIEMRALLPVVQVSVVMQRVAVLNKQRKTVLRLVIEEGVAATPGQAAGQRLSPALRLEPVRGYRRPLLQARSILEEKLHLEPAECLLEDALRRVGRQAQDYSGKLKVALESGQPTGAALRSILLHLLETMECNLEGTRADLDSEFLHDFRVAVRRTRSVFSQIKGVLPPQVLQRFRAEFKWLGRITGPTRDLDVYLLKLPAYRQSLPAGLQTELDPLQAYLEKHQREEQRKLARQLGSTRFRRLIREWRQFLEDDCAATCWPAKASRPIAQVADRQIWKTYCEVLREGDAISEDSPASALHELRITCKKLRYLIEFFQSLYPAGRIRKQIKALKSLQDNLGDFHDLEVQAEAMKGFGHAMQREEHDLPGETFMAMGALIENLARRQVAERQNFAERFALFARPANRKRCEQLFNPSAGDKEQL
jgi:CHAD domain-containing protein